MLKCGMMEVEITPPLGVSIPGYFVDRLSSGIKDELYAKALVVENDENAIAIIVLDAIGIDSTDVAEIRKRVCDMAGIPCGNIMVSATHVHTGPPVVTDLAVKRNEEYMAYLVKKAADAAVIAFERRKPSRMGFGIGKETEIAFNRRYFMKDGSVRTNPGFKNPLVEMPAGPIDPEILVVRIDNADGSPMGVLSNYACHLDTVGGSEYSADYPGEISRVLKKVLGNEVVSMFATGPCGNINHCDTANGLDPEVQYHKKLGRVLAGEIIKVREKIKTSEEFDIASASTNLRIKTRKASKEDLRKAEHTLRTVRIEENELEYCMAGELLDYDRNYKEEVPVEIQVLEIGDLSVVGLPGEIFVEFGLDIKWLSPRKYNIINTLANGAVGYVPTEEAFLQGGYEPCLCGSSKLVPEAGRMMVSSALKLLEKMYKADLTNPMTDWREI